MVKTKWRIVLAVVFAVLFCAFLFSMSRQSSHLSYDEHGFAVGGEGGGGIQLRKLKQPFSWHRDNDEGNDDSAGAVASADNNASTDGENRTAVAAIRSTCRNSVQGKVLIADDRGYLCARDDVQSTGCCNANAKSASRYNCTFCQESTGCCKFYEHCISCCMDPDKKPVLSSLLDDAESLKNLLLLSVSDHFELCLAKCRTSSKSVQHENIYINPGNKFCYKRELQQRDNSP